ncbi:class I adenylate-forming enzyme family protein [Actinoplanes sp. NPDC026619]|uniref:class I adenylate-forming enzyme family protein n=1 Tax=Actinoplanes sp. NPDC026619 TaxID=3155798 RepID=UPI0033D6B88B
MLDELIGNLREDDARPALAGRVTRGELATLTHGYAAALHSLGLGAGETIGLAVRPGARSLAAMLAAYHLGLRIAVLDPTAGPDVLRARLALAEPRLILADAAAQAVAGWLAPLARRAHLALPDLGALAPVRTIGRRLPGGPPPLRPLPGPPPPGFDGDGDAVIVFTSGTTSRPRAVVHTRSSLSAGMTAVRDLVRPAPDVPVLGGTFFVLLPSLASGAPVALPARRGLGRQIRALQPQAIYLTPPQLRAALAAGVRFTGRVYSGSAPVSAALLEAVRAAGASEAWGVYALTEVFPAAAVESAEKSAYTGEGDLIGTLLPGVTATVRPTAEQPPGAAPPPQPNGPRSPTAADPGSAAGSAGYSSGSGELMLAGPTAADRYLGEAPFSAVATGDLGRVENGRVILGGRLKDMILRRAENIYPGLYEPSLHVPGVELALLVGVPAGDGDERVVAVIQPAANASEATVRAALREPLARMGAARPDAVIFAPIPLAGRSRKPDRAATARLAATA